MAGRSKSRRAAKKPRNRPAATRPARRVLPIAGVGVALIVVGYFGWSGSRQPSRDIASALSRGAAAGFSVVVVTLDTTRADHVGCYGYAQAETPTLDRLAAEGLRFTDAQSPVPMTLPAHASIFTGLEPQHHGVRHNGEYRLDASHVTLAEVLREQGYDTAAFVSSFVLDARYGLNQGFAHYDDRGDLPSGPGAGGYASERKGGAVTDAAIQWLRGRDPAHPFFLWVHYYDPHAEFTPPPPYARRFRANPYDGEIAYMDSQIARLVRALDVAGARDRLLMIIAGDHGESLGEHHEGNHSRLIYDATQRVPLILWAPALFRGPCVVDDAVVGLVDIVPTVLDLLQITSTAPCDGISLLRCREEHSRMIYMETMATFLDNGWAPLHGLRRYKDKYILAPRPEYYDVRADRHERNNLYRRASGKTKAALVELEEALSERLKGTPSAEAVAAAATAIDPEALQRLRSLGYLSGPGPADADELLDPKDMIVVWERLEQATALRHARRFDQALGIALEVLSRSPNDRRALQELGVIYLQLGRYDEAEQAFRKHTAIKPHPNVLLLLGQLMTRKGRLSEADEFLREALALEPQHGGALSAQGDLMALRGRPDEALSLYEKAKRLDPNRSTDLANRRIAKMRERLSEGR